MGQPVGCNHCHLAARVEEDMLPSFCSASVLLLPPCMACAPCPSTRLSAQRRHRRRSRHQCCLRAHQPSGHAVTPTAVGCEYTEVRIIVRSIRFAILPWGKRGKKEFCPHKEACRALGFASPLPCPRSLSCALHTSTRVHRALGTLAVRVRAPRRRRTCSHTTHGNTRLHVKSWM